jgi:hypothetical protein
VTALIFALAATVELSLGDFLEIQKSTDDELRARFKLPRSCEPSLSAVGLGRRVIVTVFCIDDAAQAIDYSHDAPQ